MAEANGSAHAAHKSPTRCRRQRCVASAADAADRVVSSSESALSDLANVTEMLDFLAQNRLEAVRVELSDEDDDSGGAGSDSEMPCDSASSHTHDNSTVSAKHSTSATQSSGKKKKKRARAVAELERDRAFAKRVYYQTLDTLESLRREVARLEAAVVEARARHCDETNSNQSQASSVGAAAAAAVRDTGSERGHLPVLLDEIDALRAENAVLESKLSALARLERHVRQLAGAELRAIERMRLEWETRSALPPSSDELRALTPEYCAQVTARALRRVLELRTRSDGSFTWGAELFGWKDFRTVEGSCITYSLEKIFLFQHYERMAQQYWELATAEQSCEQLYSPSLKVRFHILQHVDADNMLIYRTIDRAAELGANGLEQRMRTFVLTSRVQLGDGNGCAIFTCAVDPARVLASAAAPRRGRTRLEPMREELWMDNLKWLICEPMGESSQHSKLVFGGVLDSVATANPSQWILEELMIGIRYERGGRGPFNILCD